MFDKQPILLFTGGEIAAIGT